MIDELRKLVERLRERKCVCTPQNSTSVICVAHGTPWAVSQHIADELTALLERQGSGAFEEWWGKHYGHISNLNTRNIAEGAWNVALAAQPPGDNAQKAADGLREIVYKHLRMVCDPSFSPEGPTDDIVKEIRAYVAEREAESRAREAAVVDACAQIARDWEELTAARWTEKYGSGSVEMAIRVLAPSGPALLEQVKRDARLEVCAKLRRIAAQYGAGGHTHREQALNAIASEVEQGNLQ